MVDKVKIVVLERNGNELEYSEELNPNSDYAELKGVALEGSDNHLIDITDNEITFTDPVSGANKLSDLLAGITASEHRNLDQLVHDIVEDCYHEVTRSNGKRINETWWDSSEKNTKIREVDYTRSSGRLSQIVTKQYDSLGTLVETYTETITRDGDNRYLSSTGVLS